MDKFNEKSSLPTDEIIVTDRFRKELDGRGVQSIDSLVESIRRNGLFHPIVVDRSSRKLIAGGRRFTAVTKLNWPEVPVRYLDELTPGELEEAETSDLRFREIELEENLNRKDLTPVEQALLTEEIHNIKIKLHGQANKGRPVGTTVTSGQVIVKPNSGWTISKTASLRDISPTQVRRDLSIAHAVKLMPSLAKESSTSNIDRKVDRLIEDMELELERRQRKIEFAEFESFVKQGDCTSLIKDLANESIDCIITDPPYGVSYGDGSGRSTANEDFDDDPTSAMAILRSIAPELRRVLKPSGHLYAFFSTTLWQSTLDIWKSAGFDVRDLVCVWVKPGNATGVGNWDYNFANSWEPFLFANNQTRRLGFKRKNVFTYSVDSGSARHHPTQKPVELLRELIQLSTQPGDIVFDPFCGSGFTLVAALQLRRKYLGYELNNHFVQICFRRLADEGKDTPFVKKDEL